jgi:hypothetical protein
MQMTMLTTPPNLSPLYDTQGGSDLDPIYRMPTAFGPAPGPRNLPMNKRNLRYVRDATTLSVTAVTDAQALGRFLPPRFRLDGRPRLEIAVACYANIGWLAGRGYNLIAIRIPVIFDSEDGPRSGGFVPLMWENLADCLLTGRDELGVAKIFADISPIRKVGESYQCNASWDGFRFFEFNAFAFSHADPSPASGPLFFHKYIPRTGALHEADVDVITATGPDGGTTQIRSAQKGLGRFIFNRTRWEDMPTQYRIVNALAELPIASFEDAWLIDSLGGGDLMGQHTIR